MKKQGKTLILNEEMEQRLISDLISESFCINANKVLLIKDILDNNILRQKVDSFNDSGEPTQEQYYMLLSQNKQPVKAMTKKKLISYLDSKPEIRRMMSDDNDRKRFLEQVVNDWTANRIKNNGVLSVNHL